MKLYFSWIHEEDVFDPSRHSLNDGMIFSFELIEKEGSFCFVRLEMKNPYSDFLPPNPKQWCYISYDHGDGIGLLFKGKLNAIPCQISREIIAYTFMARPSSWASDLEKITYTLRQADSWDPLFVHEEHLKDPTEVLEARSELFFWCRKTGVLKTSDLFWGAHRVDLGEPHFYKTLNMRVGDPPLSAVKITLSAEWIQRYQGKADLTPFIRSCFPQGIVNTLTGEDLKKKWWRPFEKIGHSGYWVDESTLEEITPNYTGDLNLYPATSDPIWLSPDDPAYGQDKPDQPQQETLKRSWFKSKLVVGWQYHQKRQEKVHFTLKHATQLDPFSDERGRCLHLKLQNIASHDEKPFWRPFWTYSKGFQVRYGNEFYECVQKHLSHKSFQEDHLYWSPLPHKKPKAFFKPHQGCFFETERGKKAIEHALEIARAHLASSARAIDISFSGPFEVLAPLTCDHSVKIRDTRLPGQEVWGKVKSLRLCVEGTSGKKWGEVVLAVSIGSSSSSDPLSSYILQDSAPYAYEEYGEADYHSSVIQGVSPSGIPYIFPQPSIRFGHDPKSLTARDLVQSIAVKNPPDRQNKHLMDHQYPVSHHIEVALKEVPTQIEIRLFDLKKLGEPTRDIFVDTPQAWSAPQQIHLKKKKEDVI